MAAKFLFIDIGEKTNLILAEKTKEGLRILKQKRLPDGGGSNGKALKDGLGEFLTKKLSITPLMYYLSLSVKELGFRVIEVPFKEEEKLKDVIPFELRQRLIDSSEEPVYDFLRLPSSKNGNTKVLVVYSEKERLKGLLKGLSEAGIEPDVITSFGLRKILKNGLESLTFEDLVNPPEYEEQLLEILQKEVRSPIINLKKGVIDLTLQSEILKKRIRLTEVLLAILILLLGVSFSITILKRYNTISETKAWITKEFKKEFPQERPKDEVLQLRSHIKELRDKRDLLKGIPVVERLKGIKPPQGIVVDEVTMDLKGMTIKGEAVDLSGLEAFREGLKSLLIEPAIQDTSQFSGKIRFTISGEVKAE
jgi:hypothetical protein